MSSTAGKAAAVKSSTAKAVVSTRSQARNAKTRQGSREALRGMGNQAIGELLRGQTGSALDGEARGTMESNFGRSFAHVRVHTGQAASRAAERIDAAAFTHGSDIFFRDGRFQPESPEGQHLIAHELAHVVQQERGGGSPDAGHEAAASSAAEQASSGGVPVSVAGASAPGVAAMPDRDFDRMRRRGKGLDDGESFDKFQDRQRNRGREESRAQSRKDAFQTEPKVAKDLDREWRVMLEEAQTGKFSSMSPSSKLKMLNRFWKKLQNSSLDSGAKSRLKGAFDEALRTPKAAVNAGRAQNKFVSGVQEMKGMELDYKTKHTQSDYWQYKKKPDGTVVREHPNLKSDEIRKLKPSEAMARARQYTQQAIKNNAHLPEGSKVPIKYAQRGPSPDVEKLMAAEHFRQAGSPINEVHFGTTVYRRADVVAEIAKLDAKDAKVPKKTTKNKSGKGTNAKPAKPSASKGAASKPKAPKAAVKGSKTSAPKTAAPKAKSKSGPGISAEPTGGGTGVATEAKPKTRTKAKTRANPANEPKAKLKKAAKAIAAPPEHAPAVDPKPPVALQKAPDPAHVPAAEHAPAPASTAPATAATVSHPAATAPKPAPDGQAVEPHVSEPAAPHAAPAVSPTVNPAAPHTAAPAAPHTAAPTPHLDAGGAPHIGAPEVNIHLPGKIKGLDKLKGAAKYIGPAVNVATTAYGLHLDLKDGQKPGEAISGAGGNFTANHLYAGGPVDTAINLANTGLQLAGAPKGVTDTTQIVADATPSSFISSSAKQASRGAYNIATGDMKALDKQVLEMEQGKAGGPLQGYAMLTDLTARLAAGEDPQRALDKVAKVGENSTLAKAGNYLGDETFQFIEKDLPEAAEFAKKDWASFKAKAWHWAHD